MSDRVQLPAPYTAEILGEFRTLPASVSAKRVSELLMRFGGSLIERVLEDIDDLDPFFSASGPGGFYRADVVSADAGRLKVHIFPSVELGGTETGPHSHSTTVVSWVDTGTVQNALYEFTENPNGIYQAQRLTAPAHVSREVDLLDTGNLAVVSTEDIEKACYTIPHGDIHTTRTLSPYAVTLCYFGATLSPGTIYEPAQTAGLVQNKQTMKLRPKELVR